jgi:hypothetical protein
VLFLAHRFLSPWRRRRYVPPTRRFLQEPHGATFQKTAFFMVLIRNNIHQVQGFIVIAVKTKIWKFSWLPYYYFILYRKKIELSEITLSTFWRYIIVRKFHDVFVDSFAVECTAGGSCFYESKLRNSGSLWHNVCAEFSWNLSICWKLNGRGRWGGHYCPISLCSITLRNKRNRLKCKW